VFVLVHVHVVRDKNILFVKSETPDQTAKATGLWQVLVAFSKAFV